MSQIKKEKNLQKKVEGLIRENKLLRKKLSRLRKEANTGVMCVKPKREPLAEIKHLDLKECDTCRGEIKKISVYNLEFDVCQNCKTRIRIK